MAEFKLKKGYNVPLAGAAEKQLTVVDAPDTVALLPHEFRGIKPRLAVKEGDTVKIGTTLFTDKVYSEIAFVAPVSGKVIAINRGERRKLLEIVVKNDHKDEAESVGNWSVNDLENMKREEVVKNLLASGLWAHLIQRPFIQVANPEDMPRDIFISGFSTAPLAPEVGFLLQDEQEHFQLGVQMLSRLTEGSVHLSEDAGNHTSPDWFSQITGVQLHRFSGPHPAGNVGVQIHHIKPLKSGELVWQVRPEAVALIGRFFKNGTFPTERIVALAGTGVKERRYFKVRSGAVFSSFITEEMQESGALRFISGDVLTGWATKRDGFISFYDSLISVIPEAKKERKLLGYFRPGFKTPSFSKTFLSSFLRPGKNDYEMDTGLKGSHRAFVMSASDYEKVVPMNILPVPLAKSILAKDIEEMEGLGILELAEEDLALCSYICLSKTNFGQILRDGLDMIQKEG